MDEMVNTVQVNPAQVGALGAVRQNVIGDEEIAKAKATLEKYKEGKASLENRIVENEQWYKIRHWGEMKDQKSDVEPASAWLFNCIESKHADAMDNFPAPNILPREAKDQAEAKMLSDVIPVILEQNGFEETYDKVQRYKIKSGTGVYGVFWNANKLNGLGDISIEKVDLLNLFWEPGVTDIQQSRNLFMVALEDNDVLCEQYPQLVGRLSTDTGEVTKYRFDDNVDTTNKSAVIDWYYRRGHKLHLCKFCAGVLLFASENDPQTYPNGIYGHGKYPFVFDVLFPVEGSPAGFGYIDVGKDCQAYIDRGNQALMKNMLANTRPRWAVRTDAGVKEEEFADLTKDVVHFASSLSDDVVRPIVGQVLPSIYVSYLQTKVEELKETTGNRDVTTGGTGSGVTAASAIAALQESGSKLSRDSNKSAYRAFREICLIVIELIRQFYRLPRCFRIIGDAGAMEFVEFSNKELLARYTGEVNGEKFRSLPLFDIEVSAEKASPYSKLAQNELALQFYNAGFFNPAIADQALACVDMMDFDRKEFVTQRISQNGTMYQQIQMLQQQVLQLAQIVDEVKGTSVAPQLAAQMGIDQQEAAPAQGGQISEQTLDAGAGESRHTRQARERVAQSTSPK